MSQGPSRDPRRRRDAVARFPDAPD